MRLLLEVPVQDVNFFLIFALLSSLFVGISSLTKLSLGGHGCCAVTLCIGKLMDLNSGFLCNVLGMLCSRRKVYLYGASALGK